MSDERGVSTALGYVLALGISALLITGLITAGGGAVSSSREEVTRTQLSVIGYQLADDIDTADRLVQSSGTGVTLEVTSDLPRGTVGSTYQIRVETSPDKLVLTAAEVDVTVEVGLTTTTSLQATTVSGGSVRIEYSGSDLVIENV